jgi:multiple sugar transport system ATP-binding protein
MTNLAFDNVTKNFGDVQAVNNLSMELNDGEFLVIVGPSGCGKTTLLRMVAGLEDVTNGEVRLGGDPIQDQRPQDRDIAMVFQSYALYPHMTVRGNMSFGLQQSTDLDADKINKRVTDIGNKLDISELLDRQPSELSGGQRQRVALGRAIIRDPEVFLLDEPLSNLDAKLRAEMRTELQRLQNQLNVMTIYVTHDQTEAMTMGDRIAVLNDGELQQIGTPTECYHEPNNRFVGGFIGEPSMNFIETTANGDVLRRDGFTYQLSEEMTNTVTSGESVTLGIRPEEISLTPQAEETNEFTATIDVVETGGKEHNYYLWPEQGEFQTPIIATVNDIQRYSENDRIGMVFSEEKIHLFHGETGNALHYPSRSREVAPTPK